MKQIDRYRYEAEKGCFIVRISNNEIMGEAICLGDNDTIENFKDELYTDESYKAFYEGIGFPINSENNIP